MANTNFNIRIKVDDGRAKVQIDGLTEGFVDAGTAVAKLRAEIERNGKAMEGTAKWYRQQISLLKEQRDMSAKTAEDYARQTKAIEQVQRKYRSLASEVSEFTKVNQDQISNAGLAGATLTELGRTISDLPYGMRGVANNLSQLATLFFTLSGKTGGFVSSLRLLKAQLSGPLGVILAFQALISLLDFLIARKDKAKDSTDDLTDSMNEELIVLRDLNDAITDNIIKREQAVDIAKGLLKTDKELKKIIDDTTLSEEERADAVADLLQRRQKEFELEERVSKLRKKIAEDRAKIEKIGLDIEEKKQNLLKVGIAEYGTRAALESELNELGNQQIELTETQEKTIRELGQAYIELSAYIDDTNKKREKEEAIDLSLLTDGKDFKLYKEMVIGMTEDQLMAVAALVEQGKIGADAFAKFVTAFLAEQKRISDEAQQTFEREVERNKQLLAIYESFKQATDTLFEAEISREERRTVLKNNELRKQLKNEQLTAQQREAINSQIATNEENLDRKRDKIAERQFKIQKALMIGEALVTTYKMANSAYEAVLVSPLKFLGIGALVQAKIAAGIATAFGLANVAAIARQQFVPSAIGGAGGGGAGGAGGGVQAPDFNIVGASAQSQLAETVATAESQPVRAYVVGKDVSTQQELDRNITNTASFG